MNLLQRFVGVFVSPGKTFEWLAKEPRWVGALVLAAVFAVVSQILIPADLMEATMRTTMIEQGQDMTDEQIERFVGISRMFGPVFGVIAVGLITLLAAGLVTGLFAFLMGDNGTFKQYFSATAHAFLISGLGTLVVTPLRVISRDLQLVVGPGSVLGGMLGDGYLSNFFRFIDVFMIWALAVLAIGVTKIDPKRDFATAFAGLMAVYLIVMAGVAVFL